MNSVAAVTGIRKLPPEALDALADLARRHGWDLDGLAAAIAHESGWNPHAANPTPPGAVGLLQWLPTTLARYGTNASAMVRLGVVEQLPYVERYFREWEALGYPIGPRDFLAYGLGVGHVPRPAPGSLIPDDAVLYEADSPGAIANPALADADGTIRMGGMRRILEGMLLAASRTPRVDIPASLSPKARLARLRGAG